VFRAIDAASDKFTPHPGHKVFEGFLYSARRDFTEQTVIETSLHFMRATSILLLFLLMLPVALCAQSDAVKAVEVTARETVSSDWPWKSSRPDAAPGSLQPGIGDVNRL